LLTGKPPRPFSRTFEQYAREHFSPERIPAAYSRSQDENIVGQTGLQNEPLSSVSYANTSRQNLLRARLDIWLGKGSEVVINFIGPYSLAQICTNQIRIESNTIKRFESRVRTLPQVENWRLEKQEIGQDICDLFNSVPQLAQIYTGGRAVVSNDEQLLLTFRCPQEMLSFPFEFINCLSVVDEGQRHLVLTHPMRKSLLGIRSKRRQLSPEFYQDPAVNILLVSSNVSGAVQVGNKTYTLPNIPAVFTEVETLKDLIDRQRDRGNIRCSVEVKHDVTREEMINLLLQDNYDLIHFSGHGFYTDAPESSCLFFWNEGGANQRIGFLSANELNNLVEQTRLKFIYLSCCQGAVTATTDFLFNNDFLGIAHSLLVGGVPSVLSMRWPLNDDMAVLLASSFYTELLRGTGLEVALFRARKQVQARMPNDFNWLSPVLVIQSD
jgi:CHAT domain